MYHDYDAVLNCGCAHCTTKKWTARVAYGPPHVLVTNNLNDIAAYFVLSLKKAKIKFTIGYYIGLN